jgi:hypothetical protein
MEMPIRLQRTTKRAETVDKILDINVKIDGLDFQAGEELAAE